MTDTQYMETFSTLVKAGQVKGKFGPSVLGFFQQKNYITDGQMHVVKSIVDKAAAPAAPAPEMEKESVGDFSGVIELFKSANLKYPKITIGSIGPVIQLSLAGAKAKKPGTINVTDGKPFGQNIWYGRVNADGTWEKSFKATDEIGGILKGLSEDPAGFASAHGDKHGSCCFCNKTLTHPNSVSAGFGPVCADNWGLKSQWKASVK